jgi:ubiquinone/menaquinone biosynthesis C-methylase UbiE
MALIDYDAELQLHNDRLRAAYDLRAADRVLDIGCGAGQTTRQAAQLATHGSALGIDLDGRMIERARQLATAERVANVTFEVGDAQTYPFRSGEFDIAISRFGTMFFTSPVAAFRNIAYATRAGGRLLMMVWQPFDQNEWAIAIDRALAGEQRARVGAAGALDPFSLGDQATVRQVLGAAGFIDIAFAPVDVPVYYGPAVDSALAFVSRFTRVSDALGGPDPQAAAAVNARLGSMLQAHHSERGVWLDSRAWVTTARRR